ncbi:MAG: response regulator transcription factor [Solirubrobacterales bacterium]|nr:response regulator transcription factor [Solirubrobacterales bacterium]MBV9535816.1 response regulator transcription factor [Solirubrobacterales bacterium]
MDTDLGARDGSDEDITVLLADDHAVVRAGLRLLLDAEEGMTVVAEAGDIPTTMRKVRGHRPRVLILDLNMGGASGLAAIPTIQDTSPETRIVVLTMQDDPVFAHEALAEGALGYVLKEAADTELLDAVRHAAQDKMYVNPGLGARLATEVTGLGDPPPALSARETEVLGMIADGYTNPEIADRLCLSVRTIESHRAHIHRKTGRTTRAELVALARELGASP